MKLTNVRVIRTSDVKPKKMKSDEIRLGFLSDWNSRCGISTYSKYLLDGLIPKIKEYKIFSEVNDSPRLENDDYNVDYCWKRGQPLVELSDKIKQYNPSVLLMQHEFGLFPKANYFFKFLESIEDIPLLTTMHSVYKDISKSVFSSLLKNVVVHSKEAENCLRNIHPGKELNTYIIPHGCIDLGEVKAAFNSFHTPYVLMQFGFGFDYKGCEIALKSLSILKERSSKYNDIFYIYLLSENPHTVNVHNAYANKLKQLAEEYGVSENFSLIRGFKSDDEINSFLRTTRLAIYPYIVNPSSIVFGSSGSVRIAMANNTPVICSDSPMFSDLEGVCPRPSGPIELADQISKVFSDGNYRKELLRKQREYILNNTWEITADRYKDVLLEIQNA